jgi:hypothetical protein
MKLDWELIDKLSALMCSEKEIAYACNCSTQTLRNRCVAEKGCKIGEYIREHMQQGLISLRRLQWASAQGQEGVPFTDKNGAPIFDKNGRIQWRMPPMAPQYQMQIFLGKNYLGQSDRQEITGRNGEPIKINVDAKEKLLSRLNSIAIEEADSEGSRGT